MISRVVETVLPGARVEDDRRLAPLHGGRPADRRPARGAWLELASADASIPRCCAAPVSTRTVVRSGARHGVGAGADAAQGHPDIRYLRAEDRASPPRCGPWRRGSTSRCLPATRRDISVVVGAEEDEETLGDRIRIALATTRTSSSPSTPRSHDARGADGPARARLGTRDGQVNLLLRIVLRPIDRTLTRTRPMRCAT